MENPPGWRLLCLVLACPWLLGSAAFASRDQLLTGVVLYPAGEIKVVRPGKAPSAAQPWEEIPEGTTVEVPAKGSASVICSSGHLVRLRRPGSWTLDRKACAKEIVLTGRQLAGLRPRAGRFVEVGTFFLTFKQGMRGGKTAAPHVPQILSPRWSAVKTARPELRWTWSEGTAIYEISGAFEERVDAELVACPSAGEWGGARVCSMPWPDNWPDLTPGQSVSLRITAQSQDGARSEGPEVGFFALQADELAGIEKEDREIGRLDLDEAAAQLARADLLARSKLHGDAIQGYRRALALVPSPPVQVTLGDLYVVTRLPGLARPLYEAALASGAPDVQAAGAFGLGCVEEAEGALEQAGSRFRQAADLYTEAGLADEAAVARQAEAGVRKKPSR